MSTPTPPAASDSPQEVERRTPNYWCPECSCRTFARCDEQKPDGKFGPGHVVRCVNCKRTYYAPSTPVSPAPAWAELREAWKKGAEYGLGYPSCSPLADERMDCDLAALAASDAPPQREGLRERLIDLESFACELRDKTKGEMRFYHEGASQALRQVLGMLSTPAEVRAPDAVEAGGLREAACDLALFCGRYVDDLPESARHECLDLCGTLAAAIFAPPAMEPSAGPPVSEAAGDALTEYARNIVRNTEGAGEGKTQTSIKLLRTLAQAHLATPHAPATGAAATPSPGAGVTAEESEAVEYLTALMQRNERSENAVHKAIARRLRILIAAVRPPTPSADAAGETGGRVEDDAAVERMAEAARRAYLRGSGSSKRDDVWKRVIRKALDARAPAPVSPSRTQDGEEGA